MSTELLATLREIVGTANVLTGAATRGQAQVWETHQPCHALAVVRPAGTAEVSAVMAACFAAGQSVVPYGGLTNLVQGCATTPKDIALSFARMNRIEEVDTTAYTMVAEAGVTMAAAQDAASAVGLFFPVDIGARGTCMLGGNVSSNAGGTKVIRYGMMRDSVLGLEAVLADGTVLSSMNRFVKNNSGFDLKHLFIGTEGVLGLVTRVVLRMVAQPTSHNVALVSCADYERVVGILNRARAMLGGALCGFEVMWQDFYRRVTEPPGTRRSPLEPGQPYYVIVEAMGTAPGADDANFEALLAEWVESALIEDGVVAKSARERDEIWGIRGDVEWLVRDCYNFDVSLPIADAGQYVETVMARIKGDIPDALVAAFGHLGDNNVHLSVLCDGNKTRHAATIEGHVYESLVPFAGAISAEHGIGLEKMPYLPISRSAEELSLMGSLKRCLDPKNILNPGKVVRLD